MYIEKTVKEYVEEVGSDSSMPGGGSVAALVGSLAASLTQMCMHFTKGKEAYEGLDEETKKEMIESIEEIENINEKLKEIIDEDTKAFNSVLEAYRLPSDTDENIKSRDKAIEEGYEKALSVPYECFKLSYRVLQYQKVFAKHGSESLITDVGIGSILAYASMESSTLNIKINLKEITDMDYREKVLEDIEESMDHARSLKNKIISKIKEKIS